MRHRVYQGTRISTPRLGCARLVGLTRFRGSHGKRSCDELSHSVRIRNFKTGQAECRPCPGGTYGVTMEDGSNGCRRCEKEAVAEADGTISFTFAIGDVEGATNEEMRIVKVQIQCGQAVKLSLQKNAQW